MIVHDRYASREEIARDNARAEADKLKEEQIFRATAKQWINERMETMTPEELRFMYSVSTQVPELRAFFKVFKELQKNED